MKTTTHIHTFLESALSPLACFNHRFTKLYVNLKSEKEITNKDSEQTVRKYATGIPSDYLVWDRYLHWYHDA